MAIRPANPLGVCQLLPGVFLITNQGRSYLEKGSHLLRGIALDGGRLKILFPYLSRTKLAGLERQASMAAKPMTFEKRLARFKKGVKTLMEDARTLAEQALEHFLDHGQTGYLTQFLEAFPRDARNRSNFLRSAPFVQWACDHAPLEIVNGKFLKDRSDGAVKPNLKGAKEKPYWDYAPTPEAEFYTESDVVVALQRAVSRLKGDRYKAKDDAALRAISRAERVINNLEKAEMLMEDTASQQIGTMPDSPTIPEEDPEEHPAIAQGV